MYKSPKYTRFGMNIQNRVGFWIGMPTLCHNGLLVFGNRTFGTCNFINSDFPVDVSRNSTQCFRL